MRKKEALLTSLCVRERMKFDGAGAQRIEQKRKKGATYLPPSSIWWSPKKGWSVEERMMKRTPLLCASGRQRNVTLCRPVPRLVRIANPIGRTGRTNWLNRHCVLPAVCRVRGFFARLCSLFFFFSLAHICTQAQNGEITLLRFRKNPADIYN